MSAPGQIHHPHPVPYYDDSPVHPAPACRVLFAAGAWQVPESERPADWQDRMQQRVDAMPELPEFLRGLEPKRPLPAKAAKAKPQPRVRVAKVAKPKQVASPKPEPAPKPGKPPKAARAARPQADIEVGKQYGQWTVIGPAETRNGKREVMARCACGTTRSVRFWNLKSEMKACSRACICRTLHAKRVAEFDPSVLKRHYSGSSDAPDLVRRRIQYAAKLAEQKAAEVEA